MFKVSIVIVSDTCAKDHSADLTAEKVGSVFSGYDTFNNPSIFDVGPTVYVPDHKYSIQKNVLELTEGDSPSRLILTCGGTGFTTKDITPEAISPLIERPAPGIVHAMLSKSLSITSFAMMSRPVAGTIKSSLVITLPGSPKAASENLSAIIHTMKHALAQMDSENSRALHDKMKRTTEDKLPGESSSTFCEHHDKSPLTSAGCGLAHHQLLSNDLSQGVTKRKRESLYPMMEVDAALSRILTKTERNVDVRLSIVDEFFVGSTIAEDILAPTSVPNFRASIVDGYAVHHTDGPGVYPVVAVSHASASDLTTLEPGTISRVTTGAPVPEGATAVVMVEETVLKSTTLDSKEEKEVEILAMDVKENDNIRKIGSDVEYKSLLLNKGHVISPNGGEVGLLGSVGLNEVLVVKKPKIGILSTGSELVDVVESSNPLKYGQVYDTNRLTLYNICSNLHYDTTDLGAVIDDPSRLVQKLKGALNSDIDYLITTGGVSMGELDLLKPVIERDLKGKIHFGRVNMKPGKPTTFATVTVNSRTKYIFALPGNPVSAAVCFYVFVLPSLLKFGGSPITSLPKVKAQLKSEIRLDTRYEYQRALIIQDKDDFQLKAEPTGFQRSSRVGSFNNSNGLLVLPSRYDHGNTLTAGSLVECLLYGPITI